MQALYKNRVIAMMETARTTAEEHKDRGTIIAIYDVNSLLNLSLGQAQEMFDRLVTATIFFLPLQHPLLVERTDWEATNAYRAMIGKARGYLETARTLGR